MPRRMRRRRPVAMRRHGRPGLVGTMARTAVIAGTATATSRAVSNAMDGGQRRAAAAAAQQQMADMQTYQEAPAQQQTAGPKAVDDFDEQLIMIQKLSALAEQGVLTEEEFQAKKRQILGL